MRYYVSITETLNRVVSVDAENEEEAANKVSQAYHCEEIVLNSDDYLEDSAEVELECQDDYRKTEEYYGGDFYQHID